jgi:hypothetical protein
MAPPRRVRDETLVLRVAGKADRILATRTEDGWQDAMPSQRRFQVSPDARLLAHITPGTSALHLLRRDGVEVALDVMPYTDIRFSPDSAEIAIVRMSASDAGIDRVDLRQMKARPWATLQNPTWMEYCARGLLVAHKSEGKGAISLLPRGEGPPERLVQREGTIRRFAAASLGTRFAFAYADEVWSVDGWGSAVKKLCTANVTNMEMSPDGQAVAVAGPSGLSLFEGDSKSRDWNESGIHSVWFSPRGELAWASPEVAVWRHGDLERRLVPVTSEGKLAAMRFLRGGAGVVLSRGAEVVRWSPETEDEEVISRNDDAGHELIGADVFGGGLVMWLVTPWQQMGRGT